MNYDILYKYMIISADKKNKFSYLNLLFLDNTCYQCKLESC